MRAGKLRHLVTVEREVGNQADFGLGTDTWKAEFTAWAAIEPLRSAERITARQTHEQVTHRVRMRWRPNYQLTAAKRITYGDRTFAIVGAVDLDERRREWIATVAEHDRQ